MGGGGGITFEHESRSRFAQKSKAFWLKRAFLSCKMHTHMVIVLGEWSLVCHMPLQFK